MKKMLVYRVSEEFSTLCNFVHLLHHCVSGMTTVLLLKLDRATPLVAILNYTNDNIFINYKVTLWKNTKSSSSSPLFGNIQIIRVQLSYEVIFSFY